MKMDKSKEKFIEKIRNREDRFQRATNGDPDALMECMCEAGMFSKESLRDYYKIKEMYPDEE